MSSPWWQLAELLGSPKREQRLAGHAALQKSADEVVDAWRELRDQLAVFQLPQGVAWRWHPHYRKLRAPALVLLDLLGHLDTEAARQERIAGLIFRDPRLVMAALLGRARQSEELPAELLEQVAAAPETRRWLWEGLYRLGQQAQFPAAWATQEKMAESELVNFLVGPEELDREPDGIEWQTRLVVGEGDEARVFHLFRFRTDPPHWTANNGWMAGAAGGYPQVVEGQPLCAPQLVADGRSGSAYRRWEIFSPEKHLSLICE